MTHCRVLLLVRQLLCSLKVWDDEIAEIAQRWADNCQFEHDAMRRIPGKFSLGQNLAAGYTTWDSAIQGWYDEVKDFTYGSQAANVFSDVGHYTQVMCYIILYNIILYYIILHYII